MEMKQKQKSHVWWKFVAEHSAHFAVLILQKKTVNVLEHEAQM